MPSPNVAPFEIIAAPYIAYVGVVGAAFPEVSHDPHVADWTMIGTSGDLDYFSDGVKVSHKQSISTWRSLGGPGPRKTFRTEEDLILSLMLADLTLEQYKFALNSNAVTPTLGQKKLGLSRGVTVVTMALLLRGKYASPYGALWNAQYEVPICQQTGSPEVVFRRDQPAGLQLEWTALEDPNATSDDERFGRLVVQTADSLS